MKNLELWRTIGIVMMFVGGFMANNGYPLAWLAVGVGSAVTLWAMIQWWKRQ